MASTFTWLDYSDRDRRKMLEVMDLFREKDTRDELGIGSVRDAFADLLFPGTSTIQTRARYFLFVPWIMQDVEHSKSMRAKSEVARSKELSLVDALIDGGEKEGVIGRRAKKALKRLPSSVYWQGLRVWGIRRYAGQPEQYFRAIQRSAGINPRTLAEDDLAEERLGNWHDGLPTAPTDLRQPTTFDLTHEEARFLNDCINMRHSNTLLAWLVRCGKPTTDVDFVWEHPQWAEFDAVHRTQLHHARLFSVVMWGAALLYNLLLAQKVDNPEKIEYYKNLCDIWSDMIEIMRGDSLVWEQNLDAFWGLTGVSNQRITRWTKQFVERWVAFTVSKKSARDVIDLQAAHELIMDRERWLKRGQSRFDNARALDLWRANGAAAGIGQINYRWNRVQVIVNDILEGLER